MKEKPLTRDEVKKLVRREVRRLINASLRDMTKPLPPAIGFYYQPPQEEE